MSLSFSTNPLLPSSEAPLSRSSFEYLNDDARFIRVCAAGLVPGRGT
jgi:hypothetical protein